jgi:hypothetical protein
MKRKKKNKKTSSILADALPGFFRYEKTPKPKNKEIREFL